MNLANSIWYRNNAMFNVHGWAYSSPYYIPSAWASALLILYQGQCESLMSGISKVADSRALFYMLPPSQLSLQRQGNRAGKKLRPTRIRVHILMDEPYLWMYSFPLKKGILDDDYYFYEDGTIVHFYDRTQNKINIEEKVSPLSIPIEKKVLMLNECPVNIKDTIKKILQL